MFQVAFEKNRSQLYSIQETSFALLLQKDLFLIKKSFVIIFYILFFLIGLEFHQNKRKFYFFIIYFSNFFKILFYRICTGCSKNPSAVMLQNFSAQRESRILRRDFLSTLYFPSQIRLDLLEIFAFYLEQRSYFALFCFKTIDFSFNDAAT